MSRKVLIVDDQVTKRLLAIDGIGKDIKKAGESIEEAASKKK